MPSCLVFKAMLNAITGNIYSACALCQDPVFPSALIGWARAPCIEEEGETQRENLFKVAHSENWGAGIDMAAARLGRHCGKGGISSAFAPVQEGAIFGLASCLPSNHTAYSAYLLRHPEYEMRQIQVRGERACVSNVCEEDPRQRRWN